MEPVKHQFLGLGLGGFHRLAYVAWGEGRTQPPVLCVHGLTRNGRDFDGLAADLASSGRTVVCPDVVGRGRSGWLANPALYGYPQYLGDAAALIARLDAAEVDWVGTSMGGLIGMMLAAQPNNPIRRLVLNDVGPFIPQAALLRIGSYVGHGPWRGVGPADRGNRRADDGTAGHDAAHHPRLRPRPGADGGRPDRPDPRLAGGGLGDAGTVRLDGMFFFCSNSAWPIPLSGSSPCRRGSQPSSTAASTAP
jgi:pimeloyl-ACP methyl ester carboxylesterase